MYLLLGLIGAAIGAMQFTFTGAVLGGVIGVMAVEILSLRKRLVLLEGRQFSSVSDQKQVVRKQVINEVEEVVFTPLSAIEEPVTWNLNDEQLQVKPQKESFIDRIFCQLGETTEKVLTFIKEFFTSGNLVLKIGIIILFFGVAFLLKYVAQRNMVPIEFRLVGVAVGGMVLLVTGWWLRHSKRGYGLVLQGGGVGILYLVIFSAARLYNFLPPLFALFIMVGLVVLSCTLAVLQDARPLAVFGIVGGFLGPVLLSTGSGNHVILFSYYALLNSGILGIAWFKAWRELNLLGFFFTFGIAGLWGSSSYQPELFLSTEPFLVLFFIFYLLISIFFAYRQPLNLRGYIDGPLVFGLPLVVSGLQYFLVKDFQYGMAFSSLTCGLFYLGLATLLWRKLVHSMHILCEAFLALGVVFGTLTIPLALDGYWSASIWALEGAGIVWVGCRQNRVLARHFGLLLQFGSAYIILDSVLYPFDAFPFANRYFLGCLLLTLAALFSSYCFDKWEKNLKSWEKYFALPLMVWGLAWWYIGGLQEVDRQMPAQQLANGLLLFCCCSSIFFGMAVKKIKWPRLGLSLLLQLPAMVLLLPVSLVEVSPYQHLFRGWGAAVWLIAFIVQYRILILFAENWGERVRNGWHVVTMWLLLFIVCHEAAWWTGQVDGLSDVWSIVCWAFIPALALLVLLKLADDSSWPVGQYRFSYLGAGGAGITIALCFWLVISIVITGDPLPLPYFPLFNPLELTGFFAIGMVVLWLLRCGKSHEIPKFLPQKPFLWLVGGLFFFFINSVVARSVHFYAGVPYQLNPLYHAMIFQAAIAALWGVGALVITVLATRKGIRPLWGVGAVLLGMVVVKLFVVDLSGSGTIARIISFLVVGMLMLIIGYFSPLPPLSEK